VTAQVLKVPARMRAGITRYGPEDAADLAAFQLATFGPDTRQVDRGRDAWLFDANPCRTDGDGRDMWVCRREGAIVGQQAEIPFDLQVGGEVQRAAWGIDLMVDDAWHMRGVGPALLATQLDDRQIVCGLNMSDKGFALYERAGFLDLGVIPVYLRPLDVRGAVRLGGMPGPVRRAAPVLGPALAGADRAALAALRVAGVRLEAVERFDERVDEVWAVTQQASGANTAAGGPVLARRDLAVVGWSMDQRPDCDAMRRHYLTRGDRTLGYAVVRPAGTAETPTAVVVDYLAPPRWVAPLLLAAGVAAARETGAVALSVKTRNEPADRYLRAAGFVRRQRGADESIRFMAWCRDPGLADRLQDPARWFVTSADCDLEYGMTPPSGTG
jgi:GNAT superfamily N-acetyltransferase